LFSNSGGREGGANPPKESSLWWMEEIRGKGEKGTEHKE